MSLVYVALFLMLPPLAGLLTWEIALSKKLGAKPRRLITAGVVAGTALFSVASFYLVFYIFGAFELEERPLYYADRCMSSEALEVVDRTFKGYKLRFLEYRGRQGALLRHREGRVRVFAPLIAVSDRLEVARRKDDLAYMAWSVVDSSGDEWTTVEFVYHCEAFD